MVWEGDEKSRLEELDFLADSGAFSRYIAEFGSDKALKELIEQY